ncbi:MAG: type II toxin-antitoxin system VapC family toxin [Acidobacteria bacterium]|jgi:PIN domain nuclease of toxin-antitoxin system|nr:type II toxin-antitoxin system VapC family toxin [Acidobacteriota bacterium]
MRLLLDTHIFLWFITGDGRLPILMRDAIREPGNEVFLSVVSLWEIILKHQIGKLSLPQSPEIYIPKQRRLHQIRSLVVSENSIKELAKLPSVHRDPFDRLLICQTLAGNLTIVTVDNEILNYSVSYFK